MEVEFENISQWRLTYSLQEDYRKSCFEKHLLRLPSVTSTRDVDVQNVLSRELCAVPLDLFYVNGTVR